jgi:hypothetical protein
MKFKADFKGFSFKVAVITALFATTVAFSGCGGSSGSDGDGTNWTILPTPVLKTDNIVYDNGKKVDINITSVAGNDTVYLSVFVGGVQYNGTYASDATKFYITITLSDAQSSGVIGQAQSISYYTDIDDYWRTGNDSGLQNIPANQDNKLEIFIVPEKANEYGRGKIYTLDVIDESGNLTFDTEVNVRDETYGDWGRYQ